MYLSSTSIGNNYLYNFLTSSLLLSRLSIEKSLYLLLFFYYFIADVHVLGPKDIKNINTLFFKNFNYLKFCLRTFILDQKGDRLTAESFSIISALSAIFLYRTDNN